MDPATLQRSPMFWNTLVSLIVCGFGSRVSGLGFRLGLKGVVSGEGGRVGGLGCRVWG